MIFCHPQPDSHTLARKKFEGKNLYELERKRDEIAIVNTHEDVSFPLYSQFLFPSENFLLRIALECGIKDAHIFMSCLESTLDPNFYVTVFRLY
jgi:hypothetical protein